MAKQKYKGGSRRADPLATRTSPAGKMREHRRRTKCVVAGGSYDATTGKCRK